MPGVFHCRQASSFPASGKNAARVRCSGIALTPTLEHCNVSSKVCGHGERAGGVQLRFCNHCLWNRKRCPVATWQY
jgi:hypothetical protein